MATVSVAGLCAPAAAETVRPSLNLYGLTGLIDMPSAQSQPDAQVSLSYSYFGETQRRNFNFQILPRISGAIRYSTIENWGRNNDPRYELFDRSFDVQFTLLKEGEWRSWTPAVALGFRDFLGTGVYSSEYLVATKSVQDFTLTMGLGWGRLSRVHGIENPFCAISSSACDRENDFGEGGKVSTNTFFRGQNVALFGGVEWQSPVDGLSFKAEYSSDDYKREQRSPTAEFKPNNQFNFGAEYRIREGITIGGYYMYGSEVGVNLAISGNPLRPLVPPDLGTGPLPVNARAANAPQGTAWATNPAARDQLAVALAEILRAEGMLLDAFSADPDGRGVEVAITNLRFQSDPKAIGRTTRVLAAGLPASVETFRVTMVQDDVRTTTVVIDRSDFERQVD
ncbi:MAG: YjbH domain-containing protein, partial [Rhodobacteraceae bacterium]|nr:YjbH domain-containing protein [Paracoccaceae bacterium]